MTHNEACTAQACVLALAACKALVEIEGEQDRWCSYCSHDHEDPGVVGCPLDLAQQALAAYAKREDIDSFVPKGEV